jgi:hypothetical protein
MPNIDLSILNQRQTPAFYASSLATRPAFGFAGRIFIDTDSPSTGLYRDTGSAWVQIADPGAGTTGTLQQVTTNGNTTTQGITITAGGLSSNIVTIAANGLSSTANYIGQAMANNDNWKIFGTGPTTDLGEMVFQVGDNGSSYASGNGERFRFSYDVTGGTGSAKDVFIVDYDSSNFNTNLIVSSGNNLGVGVSVPSGLIHADGGASVARMIIDADNGIARIFSFRTDNLPRWAFRVDGTETGSNVGGDFSIRRYDDTGAFVDAPLLITRSTGQSTFSKKVVIENNAGDQNLQIVSTTAPSIRLDNIQIGATKRAGLGISTATNNFIQGSADRDFCMFNGSTTASPILFGIYDTTNVAEAARISAARNFLIGTTTDAGQKLQVSGTALITGITTFNSSITATNITNNGIYYGKANASFPNTSLGYFALKTNNLDAERGGLTVQVSNSISNFIDALSINWTGAATFSNTVSAAGTLIVTEPAGGATVLQLQGASAYGNTSTVQFCDGRSYIRSVIVAGTANGDTDITFGTQLSGTTAERMQLTRTGNLLIGTTTDAGQKLQVNGNASIVNLKLEDTANTYALTIGAQGGTPNIVAIGTNAAVPAIQAFTNNFSAAQPLSLNHAGGNVLIGTSTNGASKLRIVGLPTSAAGLSSGDIYSNAGILTIVP